MNKYIMANIQLPLKINQDGSFTIMSDNTEIFFRNFEGNILAEKSLNDENTSLELNDLISKIVFPDMLQPKKLVHHMSFKNQNKSSNKKKKDSSRFTAKSRNN